MVTASPSIRRSRSSAPDKAQISRKCEANASEPLSGAAIAACYLLRPRVAGAVADACARPQHRGRAHERVEAENLAVRGRAPPVAAPPDQPGGKNPVRQRHPAARLP